MSGIDVSQLSKGKAKDSKNSSSANSLVEILNKDISFFKKQLSDKKKESFYLELNILLSAGIDIRSALDLLENEQDKEKDKTLIATIKNKVIKGAALSEALKETDLFSDYEIFSLQIGEETGKVTRILEELSGYFKNKTKQRRQAVSALSYPLIVLTTSVGVMTFMLKVIVPMFQEVFSRFGGELPYLTRMVISASDFFGAYFIPFLLVVVGIVAYLSSQRKKTWFRKSASFVVLKLPVLGELVRKIYLARFCQSMHLLISSRIPLLRALGLAKKMIGFYPVEVSLETIEKRILKGDSLNSALSEFPIYHKRLVSLIKVGEEVNKLDEFFERISAQYTEDIDHHAKLLSSMLEPFLIIFLGIIVGIILVAMYLPMFNLSSVF